jgi:hypothetical protein
MEGGRLNKREKAEGRRKKAEGRRQNGVYGVRHSSAM